MHGHLSLIHPPNECADHARVHLWPRAVVYGNVNGWGCWGIADPVLGGAEKKWGMQCSGSPVPHGHTQPELSLGILTVNLNFQILVALLTQTQFYASLREIIDCSLSRTVNEFYVKFQTREVRSLRKPNNQFKSIKLSKNVPPKFLIIYLQIS